MRRRRSTPPPPSARPSQDAAETATALHHGNRCSTQRCACGGGCAGTVATTEQDRMHQQGEKLVQRDALLPTGCQWGDILVAGEQLLQVRETEQSEHRQVGFPVPARRRGPRHCAGSATPGARRTTAATAPR